MSTVLGISAQFISICTPSPRPWVLPRPAFGWFELMMESDVQTPYWREHFRMRKETFLQLVQLVGPVIERHDTRLRKAVSTPKRVAIALWRLANGTSYRDIGTHFDQGKSTCITITKEFCQVMRQMAAQFIKFPRSRQEFSRAIALFEDVSKIPQAMGAIDGTHIEIIAPPGRGKFDYFDREHRYSVTLQAVVGDNLEFLDTAVGFPGSMHDARVLQQSELFKSAENGDIFTDPHVIINGTRVGPLLLGDGAYPLLPWLIKPFPLNVNLTASQRRFNRELSSARATVERAFGILKARWRILLKRLDCRFTNISEIIIVCCILHNFCLQTGDNFDDEEIVSRLVALERQYNQSRRELNIAPQPQAQTIRRALETSL